MPIPIRYLVFKLRPIFKRGQVDCLDGLKQVTSEQAETLKSLSEQFTSDWKAWQDYLTETREQVQKVFEAEAPETAKEKAPAQKSGGNKSAA